MPEAHATTSAQRAIEIFRAGRHIAMDGTEHDITRADLVQVAQGYDAAFSEAPLVVGHPQVNAPAYGWVRSLEAQGDVLVAKVDQVCPEFSEMVKAGRFKKVSASFFGKSAQSNPKPGALYLRHVGFLGAQPPAVKGLRDAQFAAVDEGVITFGESDRWWAFRQIADALRKVRDFFVEKEGAEHAEQMLPGWMLDSIADAGRSDPATVSYAQPSGAASTAHEEFAMSEKTVALTERETALAKRESDAQAREARLVAAEVADKRKAHAEFAESLVAKGSLLPRQKAPVVEILSVLSTSDAISFAEGDQTITSNPAEQLQKLLAALPAQIDFAEKAAAEGAAAHVDFAAPPGVLIDPASLAIHHRAVAYQRQHKVPYDAAVDAVMAAR